MDETCTTHSPYPFNSFDFVRVGQLLNKDNPLKFFIPAYQRGYRWGAKQVENLIEDLLDFAKNNRSEEKIDNFYCLQPVVVKWADSEDASGYLEVIDGQQRLTTVLLLLQALKQLQKEEDDNDDEDEDDLRKPRIAKAVKAFEVKYETRTISSEWLKEVGSVLLNEERFNEFSSKNPDYYHIAQVFKAAYEALGKLDDSQEFRKLLINRTRIIWFVPDDSVSGSNAEVFDRINAGKIGLNNAELIKALFLQKGNLPHKYTTAEYAQLEELSIEWDKIEKRLQNREFWGFIYRSGHPFSYDSHIEYLFDLIKDRREKDRKDVFFTFNNYLEDHRIVGQQIDKKPTAKLEWVIKNWNEVKNLFSTLTEWYADKALFHRIGYLLNFAGSRETVITLRDDLAGKKHDERIAILDEKISKSLKGIDTPKLFHHNPEMTQVLFLYNILLEDNRWADNARFSFADYKGVEKGIGWNQEHVASNNDYSPGNNYNNCLDVALDIIELYTGHRPEIEEKKDGKQKTRRIFDSLPLGISAIGNNEKDICIRWSQLVYDAFTSGDMPAEKEVLDLYDRTLSLFDNNGEPFDVFTIKGKQFEEKNFIWNFVLLNEHTNKSYGNSLFPVKRKRILKDEFEIYTPVGTRNVFMKASSVKTSQMFSWTHHDAELYWQDISNVMKPYITFCKF